jgi:hypothetical protein
MITLGLHPHNGTQFGMKFKGSLAIGAPREVRHDLLNSGIGQFRIKE